MLTLYLVRHGKSSWKYPELEDRQRPLKSRGEGDAELMGKLLTKKGIKPGLVLSSPAVRAFQTACIFSEQLGYSKKDILKQDGLYFQGTRSILEAIRQNAGNANDVFVFGHNPDTLDLVNAFAGKDFDNVPTSGVACVQFDVSSWNDISIETGELKWLDYPSLHKG